MRNDLGNPREVNALNIESGQELERFIPNRIKIGHTEYLVLTGWEGTGRCFWCGGELKGKLKRYCYGHMKEYYRHFFWQSARDWCIERQEGLCANCHRYFGDKLEVHHIVPLNGFMRWVTPFNLPWNLIGFCHEDHLAVAAAMRPPKESTVFDSWKLAEFTGQTIMSELGGINCLTNQNRT